MGSGPRLECLLWRGTVALFELEVVARKCSPSPASCCHVSPCPAPTPPRWTGSGHRPSQPCVLGRRTSPFPLQHRVGRDPILQSPAPPPASAPRTVQSPFTQVAARSPPPTTRTIPDAVEQPLRSRSVSIFESRLVTAFAAAARLAPLTARPAPCHCRLDDDVVPPSRASAPACARDALAATARTFRRRARPRRRPHDLPIA